MKSIIFNLTNIYVLYLFQPSSINVLKNDDLTWDYSKSPLLGMFINNII